MPLKSGTSRADFESNLKTELEAGRSRAQALAIAYSKQAADKSPIDPESVRVHDPFDGKMHVTTTHISKAMVCPYYGREIPEAEALGLEPDRIYMLLRDPDELAKAAPTSNGIPFFNVHIAFNAENLSEVTEYLAGTVGTDASFNYPYLDNSLVFWSADAIEDVESEDKRELSCSYRYRAVMAPGNFEGVAYDGKMVDIVFNHVAQVTEGRAGPDVLVADSRDSTMPLSRRAILAQGALSTVLRPILAADAKIDFKPILGDVTSKNFTDKRPAVIARLGRALAGKTTMAFDAEKANAALKAVEAEDAEMDDEDMGMDWAKDAKAIDKRAADRKMTMDAMCAEDGEEETDEDRAEREKRDKAEDARRARDGEPEETEAERKERYAKDRKRAKDKKAKDKAAKDAGGDPDAARKEKGVDKAAMDAAIKAAEVRTRAATLRTLNEVKQATEAVRPHIGELHLAMDSGADILRLALDGVDGIELDGSETYGALLNMVRLLPPPSAKPKPTLAMDAVANDAFASMFPDAKRIRHA